MTNNAGCMRRNLLYEDGDITGFIHTPRSLYTQDTNDHDNIAVYHGSTILGMQGFKVDTVFVVLKALQHHIKR